MFINKLQKLKITASELSKEHHDMNCEPPENDADYYNCDSTCTHLIWLYQDICDVVRDYESENKIEKPLAEV